MQARARAHDDDNVLNSSVDFFSAALYAGRISSVRIVYAGVSEREREREKIAVGLTPGRGTV